MTPGSYSDFRETGIEWMGKIPSHWGVMPLKRVVSLCSMRADERLFPVALEHIESWTGRLIPGDAEFSADGVAFTEGDILFGKLRPYLAKVWVADRRGEAVGDFHVMRPAREQVSDYLSGVLLTREVISLLDGSTRGAKMPRVGWDFMGRLMVPVPPRHEQTAIAAFLNRETSRIDSLIAEQGRLIALLHEKLQATVTKAVTVGLDADHATARTPSNTGVPSHWTVTPLMWLTQPARPIMYGIVLPGPDVADGIPVLKGGNVRPSRMNLASMARTTREIEAPYARARLRAGDLVYSIRGSIGDCEIVPEELEDSNITQDVARVAPNRDCDPRWLRYALLSRFVRDRLAAGSIGAAVRGINIFDLKRARIPTPPHAEQVRIADFLDELSTDYEALATEAERVVILLKERRAALTWAAVTGRIDTRGQTSGIRVLETA